MDPNDLYKIEAFKPIESERRGSIVNCDLDDPEAVIFRVSGCKMDLGDLYSAEAIKSSLWHAFWEGERSKLSELRAFLEVKQW